MAAETGNTYSSKTMWDSIEIPTANPGFSTMVSSVTWATPLHSRRYSIPPTLVSILTIRCWVVYVALNDDENYPHFIWVLVVSGFDGTGLEGVDDLPNQNFRPPLARLSSSSGGVKPCQPPRSANRTPAGVCLNSPLRNCITHDASFRSFDCHGNDNTTSKALAQGHEASQSSSTKRIITNAWKQLIRTSQELTRLKFQNLHVTERNAVFNYE